MGQRDDFILLHGVRASSESFATIWNFRNGRRASVDMINRECGHVTVADVDLDLLRGSPRAWPDSLKAMALSPFLMLLSPGGMMRSGEAVGFGVPPYPTHWIDDPEEIARVIRAADRELAMEATRRAVAPHAPSRLSCLYCAQDTPASRNWVESMLGAESFLMRVRVLAAMSARVCDARWLDEWTREDARRSYWRGDLTADPQAEILIDGVIEPVDAEELERLWSHIDTTVVPHNMLNRPSAGR